MNLKKIVGFTVTAVALSLSILGDANAASVSVKCEVRGTTRSKISVAGAGLTGSYFARVYSGGVWKASKVKATDIDHEVEFDFDSNPNDIKAGATAIPGNFIKGARVIGSIRRAGTDALVASIGTACKVK